ncbi:lipase (class 2) domain-containing protein [Ditylenchus destructor]|uniref:Lipase (Class 2) domain-containing protein n=1 Tax=Ditylenchus destructor TaxID=166010 RepID=A0AAD4MQX8_9BILA|nr:lipase (class 2) domain-containing protein [Ditylenchus destructor]
MLRYLDLYRHAQEAEEILTHEQNLPLFYSPGPQGRGYPATLSRLAPKFFTPSHVKCELCDLPQLRRFVTAVLAYTNSSYVDIVSHSMGVSFARRLIKGGHLIEPSEESCYIGEPIHHKIHTFIGIAGANYGMCLCSNDETEKAIPACGKMNGFWPGSCNAIDDHLSECLSPNIDAALKCGADHQYSSFLKNLNKDSTKEAKFIVSMWSDGKLLLCL